MIELALTAIISYLIGWFIRGQYEKLKTDPEALEAAGSGYQKLSELLENERQE